MSGFKMEGFDEFNKKLNNLQQNIENLKGEQEVSFNELFTQDFMKKNSRFKSLEDMFKQSGFVINSQEDFKKIPDEEWGNFITSNTKFKNWEEMYGAAINEWLKIKLGL
ncbi:MAG: hypothetical protein PHC37_02065 [Candidatus Omnitrophica bacterium]|nr:hypothetical protein [Candidatus Omnitrophota bacterium]MDD5690472.1 hypothetical protein [Candidatus Omnitrophota bacterium]